MVEDRRQGEGGIEGEGEEMKEQGGGEERKEEGEGEERKEEEEEKGEREVTGWCVHSGAVLA